MKILITGTNGFIGRNIKEYLQNRYEKIYCPKLNGGDHCPLCEAREALLMEGSKKAKQMASEYSPRKYYVVKGIDRENEDHSYHLL